MTVREMLEYLRNCDPNDHIVIAATLADGTTIGVREISLGTGQAGEDGDGVEVVIDWEPGVESVTRS